MKNKRKKKKKRRHFIWCMIKREIETYENVFIWAQELIAVSFQVLFDPSVPTKLHTVTHRCKIKRNLNCLAYKILECLKTICIRAGCTYTVPS